MAKTPFYENVFFKDMLLPICYHPCCLALNNPECSPHWHSCIELLRITSGAISFSCHGISIPLHVGDIAIVNSNDIHNFHLNSNSCNSSWYDCLRIKTDFLESFGITLKDTRFFPAIHHKESSDYYQRTIEAYSRYMAQKTTSQMLNAKAEALALISQIMMNFSYTQPAKVNQQASDTSLVVRAVIQYIQDHLSDPITLEEISKHVNFSKTYICRAFRKHLDMSVVELINHMRCRAAYELLCQQDITVSECARRSGFTTLSYFSKMYQRHIGELPSDTRRKATKPEPPKPQ